MSGTGGVSELSQAKDSRWQNDYPGVVDWARDVLSLAARVEALLAERDALAGLLRDALPSLGMNGRGYAQEALAEACELLGENPEAWSGANSAYSRMEGRVAVLEAALREVTAAFSVHDPLGAKQHEAVARSRAVLEEANP